MQFRAGVREWVKPASLRKPETGLRIDFAGASRIWKGTGLAPEEELFRHAHHCIRDYLPSDMRFVSAFVILSPEWT